MTGRWFLYLNSLASGVENIAKTEMIIFPRGSMWIDVHYVIQKTLLPYAPQG